jgi:predicted transcriptional regulator
MRWGEIRKAINVKNWEPIQAVERMARENRRITVDDIAEALNISHGSAYSILL